jgi:hypothetical protein
LDKAFTQRFQEGILLKQQRQEIEQFKREYFDVTAELQLNQSEQNNLSGTNVGSDFIA